MKKEQSGFFEWIEGLKSACKSTASQPREKAIALMLCLFVLAAPFLAAKGASWAWGGYAAQEDWLFVDAKAAKLGPEEIVFPALTYARQGDLWVAAKEDFIELASSDSLACFSAGYCKTVALDRSEAAQWMWSGKTPSVLVGLGFPKQSARLAKTATGLSEFFVLFGVLAFISCFILIAAFWGEFYSQKDLVSLNRATAKSILGGVFVLSGCFFCAAMMNEMQVSASDLAMPSLASLRPLAEQKISPNDAAWTVQSAKELGRDVFGSNNARWGSKDQIHAWLATCRQKSQCVPLGAEGQGRHAEDQEERAGQWSARDTRKAAWRQISKERFTQVVAGFFAIEFLLLFLPAIVLIGVAQERKNDSADAQAAESAKNGS